MYTFHKVLPRVVSFGALNNDLGTPLSCDAVLELRLDPGIPKTIYGASHWSHIDQLRILNDEMIVLIMYNRKMHYIPITPESDVLEIPLRTWHSVINMTENQIMYQNWLKVLRPRTEKDYYPIRSNHQFSIDIACKALEEVKVQIVDI
jgi:hypothetical protein